MASTHKSLRSGTANKRPTTSIADGQIALNTNTTSPGLFFKDSTGATIIKVGPVHVGTTAPNASPAVGGSSGNSTGEVWLDTSLTPNGVKIWNGASWTNATPIGSTTVQGLLELATNAETQTGTDPDRAVTPAGLQSKVSDSTSTTSSTTIASSTAVKSAYDLANAALPKSGGTVTGNLEIGTTGSLSFEGATADAFETTIAVTDPTADRTITLPDTTGTVVTTGDTGTVTSTMIANGTIVDGDISATAEIAVSKLADGAARQLLQTDAAGTGVEWASNIDIPGTLDVTSAATFDSSATIAGDLTVDTSTLKVDSTNNRVGIGTTSPDTTLYVAGTQTVNERTIYKQIDNTTNVGSVGRSSLFITGGGTNDMGISSADALLFAVNGTTEAARIDSSGRVGIGTSSPSVTFEVASATDNTEYMRVGPLSSASTRALRFSTEASSGGTANTTHIINAPSTAGFLKFQTNSTTAVTIDASQRVGIGTTSPSQLLHVAGADAQALVAASSGTGTIRLTRGATAFEAYASTSACYVGTTSATDFQLRANNAEAARIDTSGRLLVGTSTSRASYAANLEIEATTSAASIAVTRNSNDANPAYLYLSKSRSTSVGGNTIVLDGDTLGDISFLGSDGTAPKIAAHIKAQVDGTPGANDMPGRLVFSTTADGAASPTERMRIDSSGRVGIGTTSPATTLAVNGNITLADTGTSASFITGVKAGNSFYIGVDNSTGSTFGSGTAYSPIIYTGANAPITFSNNSTERARIDSSGRLLVGTSSAETASLGALFQIQATGSSASALIKRNDNGALPSYLYLGKSRGTTVNSTTIVQSGDSLGAIRFTGADGSTEAGSIAAQITAAVDGTPGANDMPGRLVFSTTADGASSPTERMRIDSSGRLTVSSDVADWSQTLLNDGNDVGRYGLRIQCGRDDATGTNYAVAIQDGDNTNQGYITFTSGTVTYGAFTAHHPCILPEADNENGYPYGTLIEVTSIEYTQKDGQNTERGILYNVRKTQTANSRAVLGAYGSSMNGGPNGETNRHQALVLGDGHILCNNSGGNIRVGDGICSSTTPGIGQKATATPSMAIGIAQEDVTFADGEEVKLVAVQYGVRQFIPWGD